VKVLIFGGAVVLAAGSLLPWFKASVAFFTVTKNGTDGDGVLTLILAVLVPLIFGLVTSRTAASAMAFMAGALAAVVAVYDIADLSKRAQNLLVRSGLVSANIGIGLILAAIGSLVIMVGAILAMKEARRASASAEVHTDGSG